MEGIAKEVFIRVVSMVIAAVVLLLLFRLAERMMPKKDCGCGGKKEEFPGGAPADLMPESGEWNTMISL